MRCPRIHRYVIASCDGDSLPFDTLEEATEYHDSLPASISPTWVAFHEVGVKHLVENPNTIETYCATETTRLEEKLDLVKRS